MTAIIFQSAIIAAAPAARPSRAGSNTRATADDIERILSRVNWFERLTEKAVYLCRQAHALGGLLSNVDLSELIRYNPGDIG
jgi:hypothetical protein